MQADVLTEVLVPNEKGDLLAGTRRSESGGTRILLPSNTLIVRAEGPQDAAVEDNVVHMRKVVS